jgi:hypothetical protein
MARITRDSSVLNQFGSPSLNSNSFANRPTFGQTGRLFVDTTNNIIQRDTGSSWVTISGGAGSQNLQSVTTIGNTTTVGIFAGASGSLTAGRLLEVSGKTKLTDTSGNVLYIGNPSVLPNSSTLDVYGYTVLRNTVNSTTNLGPILYSQYTINYNGTGLSGFANSIFAQDIYNVSASTIVASSTQSGTSLAVNTYNFSSVATITFNQPSGTIRAASAITAYSQFQNTAAGTITHAAGVTILGIENLGGSALNITNNYQLLINGSDEFASTATITNRWGIYQGGVNDKNYFAAQTIIGSTTPIVSDDKLSVIGTIRATNIVSASNMYVSTGGINVISGNTLLGASSDNGDKLQVNGNTSTSSISVNGSLQSGFAMDIHGSTVLRSDTYIFGGQLYINTSGNPITITAPTATGIHTATAQHLPINVNGVQYYLQLLN